MKRRLNHARSQMGFSSFSAMQTALMHDPQILPRLLNFLTIQVSEMFRDPGYFRALRDQVDEIDLEAHPESEKRGNRRSVATATRASCRNDGSGVHR